ncbi:hypothetical protein ACJJTC_008095 [Scirpophaga incertulas]
MELRRILLRISNQKYHIKYRVYRKLNTKVPFVDLYQRITGQIVVEDNLYYWKKKHPNIESLTPDRLQYTLDILKKFGITASAACQNPHIFTMNPITMDNYGSILKECGFINIVPSHIIRYHTIVRSETIGQLKKKGLVKCDFLLEESLFNCFEEWTSSHKSLEKFDESITSILQVRMSVLEKYLQWRLAITSEEFHKYCKHYLPLKHKPMTDIQEALHIAQNVIKINVEIIRRNGFIISSDPIKTKLILENVQTIAGLDILDAIKLEPAILKNNYTSITQIKNILEEYNITEEAQRNCLRVYCLKPKTVQERLDYLKTIKEYQILRTNPRALTMVIHHNKMMTRLGKIHNANKQCYSLNNLVASSKVFNNYINGFGNKICGRDISILISSSLMSNCKDSNTNHFQLQYILKQLKRHKYWLHAALDVVNKNINFLKERFPSDVIIDHCPLLLYPLSEIQQYLNKLQCLRNNRKCEASSIRFDGNYNNLNYQKLSDNQLLSLVLYEIEKKHHFSGDGIWSNQVVTKSEGYAIN